MCFPLAIWKGVCSSSPGLDAGSIPRTEGAAAKAAIGHLHLRYLNPLPSNLGDIFKRFKKILVPELNMGQLLWVLARSIS